MNALRAIPFLLAVAGPAAGQELDSTQIQYRTALVAVRDALLPVGAAVQALRRDLNTAAPITVAAKTRRLLAACQAARDALTANRPVFASVRGSERRVNAARQLVAAMRTLDGQINEHCQTGLQFENTVVADSVRAWLPFRSARLLAAEQAYHEAAASFARVVEVRIPARLGRDR